MHACIHKRTHTHTHQHKRNLSLSSEEVLNIFIIPVQNVECVYWTLHSSLAWTASGHEQCCQPWRSPLVLHVWSVARWAGCCQCPQSVQKVFWDSLLMPDGLHCQAKPMSLWRLHPSPGPGIWFRWQLWCWQQLLWHTATEWRTCQWSLERNGQLKKNQVKNWATCTHHMQILQIIILSFNDSSEEDPIHFWICKI